MLRALHIGIDRHASPSINWLSCARRDALALHALFSDTLGGDSKLLTDKDATVANIEQGFDELRAAREDDLVVITFSGHGTESHELVTYDADVSDLANTCILLDELAA